MNFKNFTNLRRLLYLCLEKNIPFVCYRIPGENSLITWVQKSGSMQFVEHFDEVAQSPGFVYAPFHRRTNFPVIFFEPELRIENEKFDLDLLEELEQAEPLYPAYNFEMPVEIDQLGYLQQADKMIRSLGDGLSKTVLSRVILTDKPADFQPGELILKLADAYPEAFCHLINIPGAGCWVGATPELLVIKKDTEVHTMALAGTLPFEENSETRWQQKEIKEQEMVSDHIEQVIRKQGIDQYNKSQPESLKAGQVLHLSTQFKFSSDSGEFDFADFIQDLHPTPAVCGLPKEKALNLILDTEKHNREYYAGFCGPINDSGTSKLFVNLRCMKILSDKLALYIGGGLTTDSIPIKEWEETQWKAKTLLSKI